MLNIVLEHLLLLSVLALPILCIIGLVRYLSALRKSKREPSAISQGELKKRKNFLIVVAAITGAAVAMFVISLAVVLIILSQAVIYM